MNLLDTALFGAFGQGVCTSVAETVVGWLLLAIKGPTSIIKNVLDLSKYTEVSKFAQTINSTVLVVGAGLMIMWWILDVTSKMTSDQLSGQIMLRQGFLLIVSVALVTYSYPIMNGITNLATWSMQAASISDGTNSNMDTVLLTDAFESITGIKNSARTTGDGGEITYQHNLNSQDSDKYGYYIDPTKERGNGLFNFSGNSDYGFGFFFSCVFAILISMLVGLTGLICSVIICITSISRIFQIFVYQAFAPLPMSDVFNGNFMQSNAVRFLKKYIAIMLEFGVIVLIVGIMPYLQQDLNFLKDSGWGIFNALGSIIPCLLVSISAVGIIGKANQFANDLVGA